MSRQATQLEEQLCSQYVRSSLIVEDESDMDSEESLLGSDDYYLFGNLNDPPDNEDNVENGVEDEMEEVLSPEFVDTSSLSIIEMNEVVVQSVDPFGGVDETFNESSDGSFSDDGYYLPNDGEQPTDDEQDILDESPDEEDIDR